jgi:hypothetical protein
MRRWRRWGRRPHAKERPRVHEQVDRQVEHHRANRIPASHRQDETVAPDPEAPVSLPVTDTLDLPAFHPRQIPEVVADYLDEAAAVRGHWGATLARLCLG